MQKLQLYIQGNEETTNNQILLRVDLFKDESISLTQTIQNVKDVAKIFTSFTKTFSVPASPNNNKIFKHYYNFDIVNNNDFTQSGFDARIKKPATIELNTIPYKTGRIKLEGVSLKNNAPHTYKITFFGNTVELPDILGEDKLGSLLFSSADYNIPYNQINIRARMGQFGNSKIITPLITHTDSLYYKSGENVAGTNNLHVTNGTIKGLKVTQLKYAIRLFELILEIETKYTIANGYANNIVFSRDFFNTTNPAFYNLYMWLHRKSGAVQAQQQFATITSVVSFPAINNPTVVILVGTNVIVPGIAFIQGNQVSSYNLTFETQNQNDEYSVSVTLNGSPFVSFAAAAGNRTINNLGGQALVADGVMNVFVTSTNSIAFTKVEWVFQGVFYTNNQPASYTDTINTTSFSTTNNFEFLVKEQIPDVSIISFLTGLFKMFSLVAYVDDLGTIVVRPLEATNASQYASIANVSYYTNSDISGNDAPINYNVSTFIDVTKSEVNIALPYNEVVYAYEGVGSYFSKLHNQLSGSEWGALSYSGDPAGDTGGINFNASTEIYKVLIPFEHFKYERLIDASNNDDTDIQWGYSVNENQQPYIGKPLIFYAIYRTGLTPISLVLSDTQMVATTAYTIPSNSLSLNPDLSATGGSKTNINFNNEINEYTRTNDFTNTLFQVYHSEYIIDVFNSTRRITKLTSYLPLKILYDFKLNDTFQINTQKYIINSITTNLQNGKSEMELLNKV